MYNTENAVFAGIAIVVYAILYLALMAYSVVAYIFSARGASAMAKNRGITPHWLAWIPGASMWLAGSIADHYDRTVNGRDRKFRKLYIGLSIGIIAFVMIASVVYIAFAVSNAVMSRFDLEETLIIATLIYMLLIFVCIIPILVIEYIIYYKIMTSCVGAKAKGFIVLVIFVPYALPFLLFSMRNDMEGLKPKAEEALPEA